MSFSCYCLVSETGRTYVGFSTDVDRRLRQHNGELQGGARATHGSSWTRIITVTGFPTQQAALQFEWKWKRLTKDQRGSAVDRRCKALVELLNLEQSTSNALPFANYESPLLVILEAAQAQEFLRGKDLRYGVPIE